MRPIKGEAFSCDTLYTVRGTVPSPRAIARLSASGSQKQPTRGVFRNGPIRDCRFTEDARGPRGRAFLRRPTDANSKALVVLGTGNRLGRRRNMVLPNPRYSGKQPRWCSGAGPWGARGGHGHITGPATAGGGRHGAQGRSPRVLQRPGNR